MNDKNYNLQEGLDSVNRIKLLMGYDMSKTLNENLMEQSMFGGGQGGYVTTLKPKTTLKLTPQQLQYQKEHPEMVWDPNTLDDKRPSLNQQGKTIYPKGKFVTMTPENVGLRGVPFGFSPVDYPEYLKKFKEINKKYPKSETSIINPTTWFDSDNDDKREKLLTDLKKEYYHPEFWKGISKQDYTDYKKSKNNLNNQKKIDLKNFQKSGKKMSDEVLKGLKTTKDMPGSDYFLDVHNSNIKNVDNNVATSGVNDIYDKYDMMDNYINVLFDNDPSVFKEMNKNFLEKFWDKYGLIGEAVFWVVVDALTESMAGWISNTRQATIFGKLLSSMGGAEKVASIVRFAGNSGIPIALGVDDIIRNNKITENSIVYFIFAVLPYAHSYFNMVKPSKDVCSSIIRKMSQYNLKTVEGLSNFVKLLTEEEKSLVRKVLTMDKKRLETGIKETIDGISRSANKELINVGKSVGKSMVKNYGKSIGGFIKTMLTDVTSIEIVKKISESLGITLDDIKEKELIKLFDTFKNNPIYRSYLMKNGYILMKENPTWEISKIIDKTKEISDSDYQNKNEDEKNKINISTIKTAKKIGFPVEETLIDPETKQYIKF